ncbi:MAG TPA: AtpZ/AtpI family protein [Candidatus Saccharimonadales bacterium]|nr:AtpZ/AtpI family protein [Candidatus Saccharimonadales bacterium]
MKKAAAHPTHINSRVPAPFTVGSVGLQFLDTTWRIAVPVVIFVVLGIIADRSFGTKPWVTLAGAVLGFVLAGWLVKREIAAVSMGDDEPVEAESYESQDSEEKK